jgi:hypothetical protein
MTEMTGAELLKSVRDEHNRRAELLAGSFRRSAELNLRAALHLEESPDGRRRRGAAKYRRLAAEQAALAERALASKC